jgi:hypothetical protein
VFPLTRKLKQIHFPKRCDLQFLTIPDDGQNPIILRIDENVETRVLRHVIGYGPQEANGRWKNVVYEELHKLCSLLINVRRSLGRYSSLADSDHGV